MKDMKTYTDERVSERGKVGIPILLWLGGVPLVLVLILWLVFFRG